MTLFCLSALIVTFLHVVLSQNTNSLPENDRKLIFIKFHPQQEHVPLRQASIQSQPAINVPSFSLGSNQPALTAQPQFSTSGIVFDKDFNSFIHHMEELRRRFPNCCIRGGFFHPIKIPILRRSADRFVLLAAPTTSTPTTTLMPTTTTTEEPRTTTTTEDPFWVRFKLQLERANFNFEEPTTVITVDPTTHATTHPNTPSTTTTASSEPSTGRASDH